MPAFSNACALLSKTLILIVCIVALSLSITSALDCEFVSFENSQGIPWPTLLDPFDGAIAAKVGMFSYQILEAAPGYPTTQDCIAYSEKYLEVDTALLAVAQICSLCAPIFAIAGIVFMIFEICICNFFCSFVVSSTFIILASGLQAATFAVFAEPDFCYAEDDQSQQQCEAGPAAIKSGVAAFLFWICALLICCVPRPDPFCFGDGSSRDNKRDSKKPQQQEVVIPIVIDDDEFDRFEDDDVNKTSPAAGATSPPPSIRKNNPSSKKLSKKKSSKKKLKKDDSSMSVTSENSASALSRKQSKKKTKIRDEDFDSVLPEESGARVETKEKVFPDGTRQIDEITHHPDGTTTVKTKMFQPDE